MKKSLSLWKSHEGSCGSRESLGKSNWAPLQYQYRLHPAGGRYFLYTVPLNFLCDHDHRSERLQIGLSVGHS